MAKTPLARVLRLMYRQLLQLRRVLWTVAAYLLSALLSESQGTAMPVALPDHLLLFALLLLFGYGVELGLLFFISRQTDADDLLSELAEEALDACDEVEEPAEPAPEAVPSTLGQ